MQQRIAERRLRDVVSELEEQVTAGMQGEIDLEAIVSRNDVLSANQAKMMWSSVLNRGLAWNATG